MSPCPSNLGLCVTYAKILHVYEEKKHVVFEICLVHLKLRCALPPLCGYMGRDVFIP